MYLEWFLYTRSIISKNRNSLSYLVNILSLIGITIGVAVLVIATAVIDGFRSEFETKMLSIDPHIFISKEIGCNKDYYKIKDNLTEINNIKSINIVTYSESFFRGPLGFSAAIIKGIDLNESIPFCSIFNNIGETNYKNLLDFNNIREENKITPIILGTVLADKLGVKCDDIIDIILPFDKLSLPYRFKVVGFFRTGIYQYDEMLACTDIKNVYNIFAFNNIKKILEIRVNSLTDIKKTVALIKNKIDSTFSIGDWEQKNQNLFLTLKIQKATIFIVLSLIILVAMLSTCTALTMMVVNEISEIAILKSMGALNFSIKLYFIFRGISVGLMGSIIGILLGLSICNLFKKYVSISLPGDVYALSTLPAIVTFNNIFVIFLVTMIICLLFTFYPAHRASLLNFYDGIN